MIHLTSHNHPNYYPADAYVLWTFHCQTNKLVTVSFGYVHIGSNDYLRLGTGWDPSDNAATIVTYHGYYSGYPPDLTVFSEEMYVEFNADSYSERNGFNITLNVVNATGKITCH